MDAAVTSEVDRVHAAITATMEWERSLVAELLPADDNDDIVSLHVGVLVDLAVELIGTGSIVVRPGPGPRGRRRDMRHFLELVDIARIGLRCGHVAPNSVRRIRNAGVFVCAALADTHGPDWWSHRLVTRALVA